MKKVTDNKLRLGIFVSLAILLFTAGIYFIGERQQLFTNTFQLTGIFRDIAGLRVGNNVRFAGITVGIVSNIAILSDTSVLVEMEIDEDVRKFIKKDCIASIGTEGLMGNKLVTLSQGSADPVVNDGDYVRTVTPANMDDILASFQITGENAATITTDLAVIVENIRSGKGTVGKLFMDSSFARNIDQTVVSIKQGAGKFKTNMDAASKSILLRGIIKKDKKEEEKKKSEQPK